MNYAIINTKSVVINIIEWDGITPWEPPAGCIVVATPDAGVGWGYVNGHFTQPPEPPPGPQPEPPPVLTTEQKLLAAGFTVVELRTLFGLPTSEV